MVSRGRLNRFIAKRCHQVRRQVRNFCTTGDPEALHQLRVETKKLKACLCLLQAGTHPHPPGTKGLKDVYKTAGLIRTAQINLQVLQTLELENAAFVQAQQKVIEETSALFCRRAHHYRQKLHAVQAHLQGATHDIKPSKVRALYSSRLSRLSLFFASGTLDTLGLHQARKDLKELMYIHGLLPPALAASLGVNAAYLDELQHKIGEWHDNTVALSLLQGFAQPDPSLEAELQSSGAALLQQIGELTAGFTQKVHAPVVQPVPAAT